MAGLKQPTLSFILHAAWLCVPLAGCQVALDVDRPQCDTDTQCVGLFGRTYICSDEHVCIDGADAPAPDAGGPDPELPAAWACLSEGPREVAPVAGRTVNIRFAVTDFVELTVPEGLRAKACDGRDVSCANPVIDDVEPDSEGFLNFDNLPHAWRGYTVVSAPDYVDSLVYSNRPFTEDSMPEGPTILTPATIEQIAKGGNEQVDRSKGIAIVIVYDCEGNAGPGVRLEQEDADNVEPAFYFASTLPDRQRTATTVSTQLTRSMAEVAAGGFSQIEPGYVTFLGILEETGETVGRVTVQIRAFNMTFAEIHAGY